MAERVHRRNVTREAAGARRTRRRPRPHGGDGVRAESWRQSLVRVSGGSDAAMRRAYAARAHSLQLPWNRGQVTEAPQGVALEQACGPRQFTGPVVNVAEPGRRTSGSRASVQEEAPVEDERAHGAERQRVVALDVAGQTAGDRHPRPVARERQARPDVGGQRHGGDTGGRRPRLAGLRCAGTRAMPRAHPDTAGRPGPARNSVRRGAPDGSSRAGARPNTSATRPPGNATGSLRAGSITRPKRCPTRAGRAARAGGTVSSAPHPAHTNTSPDSHSPGADQRDPPRRYDRRAPPFPRAGVSCPIPSRPGRPPAPTVTA